MTNPPSDAGRSHARPVVRRFDFGAASEPERRAVFDLFQTVQARRHPDDPLWPFEAWLDAQAALAATPVIDVERDVAWDGGRAVGWASSEFLRLPGHEHRLRLSLELRADARSPDLERDLLRAALASAEAHGATLVSIRTFDVEPEAAVWLEGLGLRPGLKTHTNQLRLDDLDRDLIADWIAAAPTDAYEPVWWDGGIPDAGIDTYIELNAILHDAPMGELEQIRDPMKPEHVQAFQDFMRQRNLVPWMLLVRRRSDGAYGGFTQMVWDPTRPFTMEQWETGVRPEHRGQGLGKWIKAAMLDRVLRERPDVRIVRTGNADENAPMLSINRRLGFRPYLAESEWEVDVAQLRAMLVG